MIRADKLSKYYGGKRALGPVSFEIEDGEAVGFLGLNGAGKTTALRILACDLRPSGGTVSIGDVDAVSDPHRVRQQIGFLPESPPVYQDMSVTDYLHFAGKLRGMSTGEIEKRLPKVLEVTDLDDVKHDIIGHLSHGYRQRVGVSQAIIHNPKLLILDEPTRGLDPVQIVEMRKMINELKQDHTVLISSHILFEIEQTCDRLLVLGAGRIISSVPLTKKSGKDVLIEARLQGDKADAYRDKQDPLQEAFQAVDGVVRVMFDKDKDDELLRIYRIECTEDTRAVLAKTVVEAGHDLLKLDHEQTELETSLMKLWQGGSDANN